MGNASSALMIQCYGFNGIDAYHGFRILHPYQQLLTIMIIKATATVSSAVNLQQHCARFIRLYIVVGLNYFAAIWRNAN